LAVSACGGNSAVKDAEKPVIQDQSTSLREPASPYRVVVPGDTLYSISWESGRDYREVAIWNKIRPPYTIKPGQEIRVVPPDKEKSGNEYFPSAPSKSAASSTAKSTASQSAGKSTMSETKTTRPKPSGSTKSAKTKSSSGKTRTTSTSTTFTGGSWSWPADGKIVNQYSETRSKGLDIGGNRGSPVRAAASGRVVYQGSGLRGYGQLIIIKHNDDFLSAYAHNDRIHVKEGETVRRGQKIADMGSSGTDQVKLHFEIRRQGQPTDPLKYLPKR